MFSGSESYRLLPYTVPKSLPTEQFTNESNPLAGYKPLAANQSILLKAQIAEGLTLCYLLWFT